MKTLHLTEKNKEKIIIEAKKILSEGGLIIVPSDTVYGVSVDATNQMAVEKLINFKSRPPGKAISVFCGSVERLKKYVEVSKAQEKLINKLLPGPYTLVLQSTHKVNQLIEAENGTLGVRIPDADFANALVNAYDKPVTATSANRAGQSPHYSIEALLNSLSEEKKQLIDLIIDAGKLPIRKPSTVVDMTQDEMAVLREGDFTSLLQLQGDKEEYDSSNEEETQHIANELIKRHYTRAQDKPLIFIFSGTLGAGKTVFVKSMAKYLGINDVVSPTFVVYYDYDVDNKVVKKFIHVDLYRLKENEEFKHLGLQEYLKAGHIMCIEWSEKSEEFLQQINKSALFIYVDIAYTGAQSRHITIQKNF